MLFSTLLALSAALLGGFDGRSHQRPVRLCYVSSNLNSAFSDSYDASLHHSGALLATREMAHLFPAGIDLVIRPKVPPNTLITDEIEWADRAGCALVIGHIASRDALLASPLLRSRGLGAISTIAQTDEIDALFPHLLSLAPPHSVWANALQRYVCDASAEQVIVVTKQDDAFSVLAAEQIRRSFEAADIRFSEVELDGENSFDEADLRLIAKESSNRTAIIYAIYPLLAIPSLEQLASAESTSTRRTILGNITWHEDLAFRMRRDLLERLPTILAPRPATPERQRYKHFAEAHRAAWGVFPEYEAGYDYDATMLALECLVGSQHSAPVRARALQCLARTRTVPGVMSVYRFDGERAHGQHEMTFTQVVPIERRFP